MVESQGWLYEKLENNLEDLIKVYRSLLDVLRQEKEILISADLSKIIDLNQTKEQTLTRLRSLDGLRQKYASELAREIGADFESPRLLEMAVRLSDPKAQKLRNIHATLELLLKKISESNKENETYAQSALKMLNGSMNEIKDTLSGQKTYKKQGGLQRGPEVAGHLVSREA